MRLRIDSPPQNAPTSSAPAAHKERVNHPAHYNSHPSGIECCEIVRHHNFNVGNAIKYLWRMGLKDDASEIEELQKAAWYIADEIERLKKLKEK